LIAAALETAAQMARDLAANKTITIGSNATWELMGFPDFADPEWLYL